MRHASLFSGIGGFDLAASWMGWTNVFQVEIDPYCQQVLAHRFPNTTKYHDIKDFDGRPYYGAVDLVSGGFPCQPYSNAGKRLGKDDARHLWPEMLRILQQIQPSYVVGENVRGLTNWNGGLVFDEVQADLELEGYEVLPFLLPAAGVNAPHRRDRIWFVAHSHSARLQAERSKQQTAGFEQHRELGGLATDSKGQFGQSTANGTLEQSKQGQFGGGNSQNALSDTDGLQPRSENDCKWQNQKGVQSAFDRLSANGPFADTNLSRCQEPDIATVSNGTGFSSWLDNQTDWREWPSVSAVCRRDDGVPYRVDRLKGLGNAIVPQVAYQIFKAIQDTH
jgi:DNA (cytosine-5)-methyltransferase 1